MDHATERTYFIERAQDFIRALEEFDGDLHKPEPNRILFRVSGRPFEALFWIDAEMDMITITTRTKEMPSSRLEDAVASLQTTLQICWDHCVSVSPIDTRYDLSMALFIGGFTFEAFDGVIFNLMTCAEAIEQNAAPQAKP